ncbi:MAG: putative toxin-antitoxin system toxin component, PIN family [Paludibacteraceae bacterium]|nr:putative toxin-antitoxin system toxin component, PIN family [Paludibacteraceae bacterium]
MKRIVLDTNCLIQMLSRRSPFYAIWKAYQQEQFALCVSNDILTEYREIIGQKATPEIAESVVSLILHHPLTELYDPKFRFGFITQDVDDNKFVDCAIVANAQYIVSNDAHFEELKQLPPEFQIEVLKLQEFLQTISL